MRINNNLGINPEVWGKVNQRDFLKKFRGKAPEEHLKNIHNECKKMVKDENKEGDK